MNCGFEIPRQIKVQLQRDGAFEEAILKNEDYIKETLTSELVLDGVNNGTAKLNLT
jgi:hypothetical protein